ncbi:protein phosphatase 2C domain-containing protein [Subtercola sp. PAMC28395]|nr:protein phosphatase 2C domain-containing protein [Subtercola sp. PAMC28395]
MGTEPPIVVNVGSATDKGLRRALNEDSFLASGTLFLVADGMGGHDAGEVASATVIEVYTRLASQPSISLEEMQLAFTDAAERVRLLPEGRGAGAGTTLSGVAVAQVDEAAYWLMINLGDSRTYRLAEGQFEQISVDHSLVQERVERGELTSEQATRDAQRNVVTRAIGAGSDSQPDYWYIPASAGDRLLVCSDGLTGELTDDHIQQILRDEVAPQAAATRLVHESLLHGGRDNVTAVVVDAVSVAGHEVGSETLPHLPLPRESRRDDLNDTVPRSETHGATS